MKERDRRIAVQINCWLEGSDGVSCFTTYDLSETGFSVVSSDPLPEGRIVTLQFFTPFAAGPFALKAEVVWSRTEPEGGMGLKFVDIDGKTRSALRETVVLLRARDRVSRDRRVG